ncbi:MAG: hypothetical protein JXL67_06175 [Calditrichaeota bacterium]|nr:hypothetical protein [Calditrichota bacterium]
MGGNVIEVNEAEYRDMIKYIKDMQKSLDPRWMKKTLKRNADPIVEDMKQRSHSARLPSQIGTTTAKRRAGPYGVRIGVIKNDPVKFPKISAQGLASILEYGTAERFRILKKLGMIVGRISTGEMPSFPFLRPAWIQGRKIMTDKTVKAIKKRVP